MSAPPRAALWVLKLSRTTLLIRFLSTARLKCFLEIANPRRGCESPLARKSTVKNRSADRPASWKTRRKSLGDKSLAERGKRASIWLAPLITGSLGGQANAALGAPRTQDLTAVASGHASTETVRACTFKGTGLKSSFHCAVPIQSVGPAVSCGKALEKRRLGYFAERAPVNKFGSVGTGKSLWITRANGGRLTPRTIGDQRSLD